MEADEQFGHTGQVLGPADGRLHDDDRPEGLHPGTQPLAGRVTPNGQRQRRHHREEQHHGRAVHPGDVGRGERQAGDRVVAASGVWAGSGDEGACRQHHDGEQRDAGGHRPDPVRRGGGRRPSCTEVVSGPVAQDHGVADQHDRQGEVAQHQPRVEVAEHHDPAQDDLCHDTGDKPPRQAHQVGAAGVAGHGAEHGQDHGHRDEAGEEAVAELDPAVEVGLGHELVLFTGRPVGTTQAGAGEPDGAAGHDDDRQQGQCEAADAVVAVGREAWSHEGLRTPEG